MVIFWVFTVCGGFTRSMVIFQKLFSQCMYTEIFAINCSKFYDNSSLAQTSYRIE